MKFIIRKLSLLFIISVLMGGLFDVDQGIDAPDFVEAKSFQYYLQTHTNKITEKCSVREMTSYGLEGDAEDLSSHNELCPNLPNGNCCGPKDIARIKAYWEHDTLHQGYYHAAYLKIQRYILGFARQYSYIAESIIEKAEQWSREGKIKEGAKTGGQIQDEIDEDLNYKINYHPMCVKSAKKFIHMDFVDRRKAEAYYAEQNRRVQYLQNSRRGFYCMLCDAKSSKYILSRKLNPFRASIQYSREFCEITHNWLIASVYMVERAFQPFLKHLFRFLACVTPKDGAERERAVGLSNHDDDYNPLSLRVDLKMKKPHSELPRELRDLFIRPLNLPQYQWLDLCYNADPKGLFFPILCNRFCDNFNMIKAHPLFDGNIDSNKLVYNVLLEYEFALKSPTENFFNDDVFQLKEHIDIAIRRLGRNYYFYRALNPEVDFEAYATEFSIFYKGVNPMRISEGTPMEFAYKSIDVFRFAPWLCLLIWRLIV